MALIVLAACSGTGKSTVARRLLDLHPRLKLSVSHTTRRPRPGEREGVHYHFVDEVAFRQRIQSDGFVEWAEYAGHLYGTAHETIAAAAAAGEDLLFDVEVVGAGNLKRAYPEAATCFLLPPTWAELTGRLQGRGTEPAEVIARRLATGVAELAVAHTFDYLVVNDDIERAVAAVSCIYQATRQQTAGREGLIHALLKEARGG